MGEEFLPVRFDGAAAWATLDPEAQARIGAAALELVCMWHGQDAVDPSAGRDQQTRAFDVCDALLNDKLHAAVLEAVPTIEASEPPMLPSSLGDVCRWCGCSQEDGCEEGCAWAGPSLCTRCAGERPHG